VGDGKGLGDSQLRESDDSGMQHANSTENGIKLEDGSQSETPDGLGDVSYCTKSDMSKREQGLSLGLFESTKVVRAVVDQTDQHF
jgi:hypothetical protein